MNLHRRCEVQERNRRLRKILLFQSYSSNLARGYEFKFGTWRYRAHFSVKPCTAPLAQLHPRGPSALPPLFLLQEV